ncbi:hypothetical protein GGU10DRAFT_431454 [Lentinula aff. detonsa]|uniref:Uncharacterized protein n=1 Tax=Lentinula aff. detonsa TaxID=2804958 RepID=A0AA38TZ46_9AGAR|nr:hypothetical protein GGU10DRAFT_431454 [Lentinula aff. detonsa]
MNTRQKLKRNTSIDAAKDPPVKKPKIRKPLDTRYETPHSSLSESQAAFKLPSSVGPYLSPSKFSPIPKLPQRTHRRTSSTNLKENASVLYSPFTGKGKRPQQLKKYGKAAKRANQKIVNSRNPSDSCSSSASSPTSREDEPNLADNIHISNISRSRVSQSTANSPAESPTRIRRPSAPTPPSRSDWKNYMSTHTMSSAVDLRAPIVGYPESYFADSNDFIRPLPNHSQLNFNRPPSQLSLYDYNSSVTYNDNMEVDKVADRDAFFTDVQGTSTPFKNFGSLDVADRRFGGTVDPAVLSGSSLLQSNFDEQETDTDNDSCRFDSDEEMDTSTHFKPFQALQLASRNKSKSGSGYITPSDDSDDEDMCRRSAWIDDSLISPPKTVDWKICPPPPEDDAYMHVNSENVMDEEHRKREHALQDLFDNMILNQNAMEVQSSPFNDTELYNARPPLRTRSLNATHPSSSAQDEVSSVNPLVPGARRTRSGTIIPGTSAPVNVTSNALPALPRRTRSGTVVPGNFGNLVTAPEDENKQAALKPSLSSRRTRSGTVVYNSGLAPSLPIVEERKYCASSSSIPGISRRARSGSIMATSSIPEGVISSSAASVASRIRSGSFATLGNTLASLPSQALKRPRSGTVGRAPAASEGPAVEQTDSMDNLSESPMNKFAFSPTASSQIEDVEMSLAFEHGPTVDLESANTTKSLARSPGDGTDINPINFLEPMVFASPAYSPPTNSLAVTSDGNIATNANARSSNGLRARAKAAASKAKGFSKNLTGKTAGAKGRVLVGPEAGAAAVARARARAERRSEDSEYVNEEDLSDDELLLK